MKSRRSMLLLCLVSVIAASRAGAVSCPGSGATLQIVVNNPTTTTGQTVFLSGSVLGGMATCGGQSDTYAVTKTLTLIGNNTFTVPAGGGLNSGIWIHHISVGSQFQSQRVPVLYTTNPAQYTTVNWKYYPSVIQVNMPGDGGTGTCTTSCTFRQALNSAPSLPTPVLVQLMLSPGNMSQTSSLSLGFNTTIDGTDPLGYPWIVGDALAAAQGNQSPFNRAIDLKNTTMIDVFGDNAAIQGLAISNTTSGGSPSSDLIQSTGANTTIANVRLDGGASAACGSSCTISNNALMDLEGNNASVANVEARAAFSNGAFVPGGASDSVISDSWFHHNYASGVRGVQLTLNRNLIDLTGRRLSDNTVMTSNGIGVDTTNVGEVGDLNTNSNLVRNSTSFGVSALHFGFSFDFTSDAVCGNGSDGVSVDGNSRTGSVTGTGLATAYNSGHGMEFFHTFAGSGEIQINDHNAFTANSSCGFSNDSNITAVANNDQWRGATTSCTGSAGVDLCTGGTGVTCTTIEDYQNVAVALSAQPVFPMNAILQGQTVRVQGAGFNAIDGNPLASSLCSVGSSDVSGANCCRNKSKANVCAGGAPPDAPSNHSMCVAMVDQLSTWRPMAVTSVTPTNMVSEIAYPGMLCIGDAGVGYLQSIRVVKQNSGGTRLADQMDYCRN